MVLTPSAFQWQEEESHERVDVIDGGETIVMNNDVGHDGADDKNEDDDGDGGGRSG